jgi:hypothetical protein
MTLRGKHTHTHTHITSPRIRPGKFPTNFEKFGQMSKRSFSTHRFVSPLAFREANPNPSLLVQGGPTHCCVCCCRLRGEEDDGHLAGSGHPKGKITPGTARSGRRFGTSLGPSSLTKPLPPNLTAHLTKYSHHPNLISYSPLLVWYI